VDEFSVLSRFRWFYYSQYSVVGVSSGYIEVMPGIDSSQQLLMISFPSSFLGDKRTAFSQSLTINFSLPDVPDASVGVEGMVELISLTSVTKPMERLRTVVAMDTHNDQQQVEVSPSHFAVCSCCLLSRVQRSFV